jgi:hypothetical protein
MSLGHNRGIGAALWSGVTLVAVVLLFACAPAAFAAPAPAHTQTVVGAAYGQVKKFMGDFDKDGFAKVVDLGKPDVYRATLAGLELKIDPTMSAVAKYDPVTKTITFSQDPRKVKPSESMAFGETVWHELTHAIEDAHGDMGVFDSEAYAERNIDYMTHITRNALPVLEMMERQAKAGASAKKLKAYWDRFLAGVAGASKLPSTSAYPPDLPLMHTWFGFSADPEGIRTLYLTDKAFSGKKWANLRAALSQVDWTGEWGSYSFSPVRFRQVGSAVTGDSTSWDVHWSGIARGNTLTGTGEYSSPADSPPVQKLTYTFTITMSADGQSFAGTMTLVSIDGVPTNQPDDWEGWRL